MHDRLGRLVDDTSGTTCEIATDTGHRYRFGNLVYKTRNHLAVFDEDDRMIGRSEVRGHHPLLDEIFDVMGEDGNFDGPRYRALSAKHGLDPDRGRPAFDSRDWDVVKALEWKFPWPGSEGRGDHRLNALANEMSELLRIDQRPDFKAYFGCQEALETWGHAADKTPFELAFDRVDVARLMSRTSVAVEIDLLASWAALRDHRLIEPRLRIDMWSCVFDPDDEGFPDSFPTELTGIAVEPEMHDESHPNWAYASSWYKVWNLAAQRVRDRLTRQGVLFLSKEAAAAYVRSEEGRYWGWTQRGDSAWQDPQFVHLAPHAPTWAEKARWTLTAPDTPLFNRFG